MRIARLTAALVLGLGALKAHAEVSGGAGSPLITVTSRTGFVPVTWSEPTNGIGFGGGGRHGGSGTVPFAGWVDFGLPADPSVTVEWNFTSDAPSQWLAWSIARLDAQDTPLAGVCWDGQAWQALGASLGPVDAAGLWSWNRIDQPAPVAYRLSFSGITDAPESVGISAVAFAVPAPGAVALVAVAATLARRRRS